MRTLAILHLHDGMIVTGVDNFLFLDLGMRDVIDKGPAYATT